MIKKLKELNYYDNDAGIVKISSNRILVNNNYRGVLIYNDKFELLKEIDIIDDMIIYSSFVNSKGGEVLLHCDDGNCFIYINLLIFEYKIVYLKNGLEDLIFSPLCEWHDGFVIMSTYHYEFYKITYNDNSIEQISVEDVKSFFTEFYKLYQLKNKYNAFKIFEDECLMLIKGENKNDSYKDMLYDIYIIDYFDKTKYVVTDLTRKHIDIEVQKDTIVVVNEDDIEIITPNYKEKLYPESNHIFFAARFLNNDEGDFIVTLSSNKGDACNTQLSMFKL